MIAIRAEDTGEIFREIAFYITLLKKIEIYILYIYYVL